MRQSVPLTDIASGLGARTAHGESGDLHWRGGAMHHDRFAHDPASGGAS